jgi:hypothetical protein
MPVVDTRGRFFQPVQRLLKLLAGFLNLWLSTACEPNEPAGAGLADKPEGWRLGVRHLLHLCWLCQRFSKRERVGCWLGGDTIFGFGLRAFSWLSLFLLLSLLAYGTPDAITD